MIKKPRCVTRLAFRLALIAPALAAFTCKSAAQEVAVGEIPSPSLMLVRAWDANTRELTGWMPTHRVAITLQQFFKPEETAPSFEMNEAVTVQLPYRPKDAVKYGQVRIANETATFEGRQWLPLDSNVNLVRIRNSTFYVKSIDLGESKWRRATVVEASSQTKTR